MPLGEPDRRRRGPARYDLAAHAIDLRMMIERAFDGLHPRRRDTHVIVREGHNGRPRRLDGGVAGVRQSLSLFEDVPEMIVAAPDELIDDLTGFVRRIVVDDNDFVPNGIIQAL